MAEINAEIVPVETLAERDARLHAWLATVSPGDIVTVRLNSTDTLRGKVYEAPDARGTSLCVWTTILRHGNGYPGGSFEPVVRSSDAHGWCTPENPCTSGPCAQICGCPDACYDLHVEGGCSWLPLTRPTTSPEEGAWKREHYTVSRSHGCDSPAPECACGSPLTPHSYRPGTAGGDDRG